MPLKARLQTSLHRTPKSYPQSTSNSPGVQQSLTPMSTPPAPKTPKFSGNVDGLPVQCFLTAFEFAFDKLATDKEKIVKLLEFTEGDAAFYLRSDITISGITRQVVKDMLTARYGHSEVPPVMAAYQRTLSSDETVRQYYDDKTRILRHMAGLTEAERLDHLTHSFPDAYRSHSYG